MQLLIDLANSNQAHSFFYKKMQDFIIITKEETFQLSCFVWETGIQLTAFSWLYLLDQIILKCHIEILVLIYTVNMS